jgi:molybdenum cofactor guanylyltransferase
METSDRSGTHPGEAAIPARADLSGIVLAGGRSRRMGRDKAALVVDGLPLLVRAVDLLRAAAAEVVVACRDEAQLAPGLVSGLAVRLAFDRHGEGPLAGIEAGLRVAAHDAALVIPVDMPGLTAPLLAMLVEAAGRSAGADVVVFEVDGRALPLPALYRRSALPLLAEQLELGRFKVLELMGRLRVNAIPAPPADWADGAFENVNDRDDLARVAGCGSGGPAPLPAAPPTAG